MELTFTPVEAPKVTRIRGPKDNPFIEPVKALVPDSGQAIAFVVPGTSEREKTTTGKTMRFANKELRTFLQQLDTAGVDTNVTIRKQVQDDGTNTTVTFWTIPKIIRAKDPTPKSE